MGYVAVKGGTLAIEESIKRLKFERVKSGKVLSVESVQHGMRGLIDQVMSESSLYSEELAAIAIKQAEGSPEEAVFLMRAYRSTLPRKHYSRTVYSESMSVERRISASFKNIPGGQILGATPDFIHRLIDFELIEETDEAVQSWLKAFEHIEETKKHEANLNQLPKVLDYLRTEGLIAPCADNDIEPDDVTRSSLSFPVSRSQKLQVLTRGQTGAVTAFSYAVIRGYGQVHPTVGELRVGGLPLYVDNPIGDEEPEDAYYIGDIRVTEVEMLIPKTIEKAHGKNEIEFDVGYGICYGQNETKAIAMSILDHSLSTDHPEFPSEDQEFVLYHIDCVEATGFVSHLKMPHYVTFQSKLDSVRKTRQGESDSEGEERR